MTTKTRQTPRPLRSRLVASASLCLLALTACAVENAPDTADEHAATSEESLSRGGGTASFTCQDGVCICSKLVPNDCQEMRKKCIITSLFQLDRCLQSWLPVCTCSMGVHVSTPSETGARGGGGGAVSP